MMRIVGWMLGDTRHVVGGQYIGDRVPTERRSAPVMAGERAQGLTEPARQVVWAAIICRGCGRRLYRDDGTAVRSWRRLLGC